MSDDKPTFPISISVDTEMELKTLYVMILYATLDEAVMARRLTGHDPAEVAKALDSLRLKIGDALWISRGLSAAAMDADVADIAHKLFEGLKEVPESKREATLLGVRELLMDKAKAGIFDVLAEFRKKKDEEES